MQPLEPEFGVLLLVIGSLVKDFGYLNVAVLARLGRVKGIFVAGLAFSCKGGHEISLGFAPFEFHLNSILSCVSVRVSNLVWPDPGKQIHPKKKKL